MEREPNQESPQEPPEPPEAVPPFEPDFDLIGHHERMPKPEHEHRLRGSRDPDDQS